jgi:ribosomal 50S subunit-associated protein YjgA (DUF615 family)
VTPEELLFDAADEPFAPDVEPLDPDLLDRPDELLEAVRAATARHAQMLGDRRQLEFLLSVLRDEMQDGAWEVLVEVLDGIADRHERLVAALASDVLTAWAASLEGANPKNDGDNR